ncbi:MAG: diacylglycerol kinase family protein [Bacillota bacterium]|jgi:diacylglycerol kinase|nr:diacylglycerol kinase family protein [Bacillota bacterium]NLP22703.1 diacylglycerol kinase family protein [Erysipelotrichaceae bacterium]
MREKFRVAFIGLKLALLDKSVFIQVIIGIIVTIISIILKLNKIDFILVLLCIGLVIATEILNTCVEELCNLYTTKQNENVKYIKDISAGAVLFVAILTLIIGVIIFLPYIRRLIDYGL